MRTHVLALCAGWAGGFVSHLANLLEQTKRSVVVVTNNRGVFMAGRVGCPLPALAGFIGPASAGPCLPGRFSPKGVPPHDVHSNVNRSQMNGSLEVLTLA
mgnify:CR=1 FL=1